MAKIQTALTVISFAIFTALVSLSVRVTYRDDDFLIALLATAFVLIIYAAFRRVRTVLREERDGGDE